MSLREVLVFLFVVLAFGYSRASVIRTEIINGEKIQEIIECERVRGYEIDHSEVCEIILKGEWNSLGEYCIVTKIER